MAAPRQTDHMAEEDAEQRLVYQVALLASTREVSSLGATPELLRERTCNAFRQSEADADAAYEQASLFTQVLAITLLAGGAIAFAWRIEGPARLNLAWLWAVGAPVVGTFWILAAVGLVIIAIVPSVRRDLIEAFKGESRALVTGLTSLGLAAIGALMWVGLLLYRHWPGSDQGILTYFVLLVMLVLAQVVITFVFAVVSTIFLGWGQSGVLDRLVLDACDLLSAARFGAVVRDLDDPWPPSYLPSVDELREVLEGQSTEAATISDQLPPPAAASWRTDRKARRELVVLLETKGRGLEAETERVSARTLTEIRKYVRECGRSVEATYHHHARAVVLGSPESDERLVTDLASAYVAACEDRWDVLTHAEPMPGRRRIVAAVTQRAATTGTLVAGAFFLSPFAPNQEAENQVRGALLAAAVLALTAPRTALTEARENLRKIFSGGRAS